ncbi:Hypothetical predicted protein [Mytilus galloprovincialis]|uniref:C-type lectin domain-containing protein n=1 Tax=Mytilus galloprovincialis TaxID=29158 RepID=A0A8B6GWM9_MYTGA|nr:Hypothetical predicted protein [Mytilus galloprovincialis]
MAVRGVHAKKALAGECANHSCKEGYKCVSERDGRRCELAYCIKRPSVANAELYEPFGLSRDLGRGMIYKCEHGFKLKGKPFAVCRNTGIWKSLITCEKPCEKGWIQNRGHNYCIGPDKKTWNDSKADCISKGSYLVKIDHAAENDWLEKVMIDNNINHMWIGAHDIGHEGSWRWVYDNTTVNYTNWPNNYEHAEGHENCAEMWDKASYRWNDKVCTSVIQYVCHRLTKMLLHVGNSLDTSRMNVCGQFIGPAVNGQVIVIRCKTLPEGQIVKLTSFHTAPEFFHLAEVEVYAV